MRTVWINPMLPLAILLLILADVNRGRGAQNKPPEHTLFLETNLPSLAYVCLPTA